MTNLLISVDKCDTISKPPVKRRIPVPWDKFLKRIMCLSDGEHMIKVQVRSGEIRWVVVKMPDWEA